MGKEAIGISSLWVRFFLLHLELSTGHWFGPGKKKRCKVTLGVWKPELYKFRTHPPQEKKVLKSKQTKITQLSAEIQTFGFWKFADIRSLVIRILLYYEKIKRDNVKFQKNTKYGGNPLIKIIRNLKAVVFLFKTYHWL